MTQQELTEIVELTPDYLNPNADWSFYEDLAEKRGLRGCADRFMWNDLVDSTEILYDFLKNNPQTAQQYNNNIRTAVNSIFGNRISESTRLEIVSIMKRLVFKDSLSDGDFNPNNYSYPELYHGTGLGALKGIAKYGELLSERRLFDLGENVKTGERQLNRKKWMHTFISLSEIPYRALWHHADLDGIAYLCDFPVVFGFSKKRIDNLGSKEEIYEWHGDAEPREVCVRNELPMKCATHLFVPDKKMPETIDFAGKYDLRTVPIEALQKYCNHEVYLRKEIPEINGG